MEKEITLTTNGDVYDEIEELPRRASIPEFVNFMLKGYVETFKKGRVLSKEEVDEIVAKMGGKSSGKGQGTPSLHWTGPWHWHSG